MTGSAENEQCIYQKTQERSRKEWDIGVVFMRAREIRRPLVGKKWRTAEVFKSL